MSKMRFSESFQKAGQDLHASGIFVGCPLPDFERISRDQLIALLMCGLSPDSGVLDIGCGCLRSAWWIIRLLDEGKYVGVEPNAEMLVAGTEKFGTIESSRKRPRFVYDDTFVYDQQMMGGRGIDYFTAFSVWSHAAKLHIEKMLDSFARLTGPGGKFVLSMFPTNHPHQDYKGETWVGRSHVSDEPGTVAHHWGWVIQECKRRGLVAKKLPLVTLGQTWIVIDKLDLGL